MQAAVLTVQAAAAKCPVTLQAAGFCAFAFFKVSRVPWNADHLLFQALVHIDACRRA